MSNSTELAKQSLIRKAKTEKALIETDQAVVIKDTYPKAQYHFLVVSKEDVPNLFAMTRDHLPLLDHMKELANQIIEQQQYVSSSNFLIGFKMDPFMNGLNMHVISNDFYSASMRRITHWNGFNTDLFLTYQAVYALIRIQGRVEPMSTEKAMELRNALPLRCNQCDFTFEYLLGLKGHLFEHWKKREAKLKIKQEVEKVTRMLDETKLMTPPMKKLDKAPVIQYPLKAKEALESPNVQVKTNPFKSDSPATNREPSNWRQSIKNPPTEINESQHPKDFNKHFQKPRNNQGGCPQGYPNFFPPGMHSNPFLLPPESRYFNQQALNLGNGHWANVPYPIYMNTNMSPLPNIQYYPTRSQPHALQQQHPGHRDSAPDSHNKHSKNISGPNSGKNPNPKPQSNASKTNNFNKPENLVSQGQVINNPKSKFMKNPKNKIGNASKNQNQDALCSNLDSES